MAIRMCSLYLTPRRLSSDLDTRPRNIPPYIGLIIDHGWRQKNIALRRSAINNAFRFFTPKFPRTLSPTWGNTFSSRLFVVCRTLVVTLAVMRFQHNILMHRTFTGITATEPPVYEPCRMSDSRGRRAAKSRPNCFVHVLRTINGGRVMQTSILPRDRP